MSKQQVEKQKHGRWQRLVCDALDDRDDNLWSGK